MWWAAEPLGTFVCCTLFLRIPNPSKAGISQTRTSVLEDHKLIFVWVQCVEIHKLWQDHYLPICHRTLWRDLHFVTSDPTIKVILTLTTYSNLTLKGLTLNGQCKKSGLAFPVTQEHTQTFKGTKHFKLRLDFPPSVRRVLIVKSCENLICSPRLFLAC